MERKEKGRKGRVGGEKKRTECVFGMKRDQMTRHTCSICAKLHKGNSIYTSGAACHGTPATHIHTHTHTHTHTHQTGHAVRANAQINVKLVFLQQDIVTHTHSLLMRSHTACPQQRIRWTRNLVCYQIYGGMGDIFGNFSHSMTIKQITGAG